jgi:cobalt-precorrin-5B (C1)-methyltransferase
MSASFIDLTIPAANGLARGMTTGSCATAAAKSALIFLISKSEEKQIEIDLPSGEKLRVPVNFCKDTELGAMAQVTKNAGDDPDVTDKCKVEVEVRPNRKHSGIQFYAGKGVGKVTEEGLQIPQGEPAINPIPRKMIRHNLEQILKAPVTPEIWRNCGLDLIVGVPGGEKIALKTFNPRLGIQGGISILGTTGIVEPMSQSAWMASIEIYIDVAMAAQSEFIVFSPGRWGQQFFHKEKGVPLNRICMVSNFIGFALDHLKQKAPLEKNKVLILAGHPAKLAKVIDGHWNTHSSKSPSALPTILKAVENIFPEMTQMELQASKTVEHLIQTSEKNHTSKVLFAAVAEKISQAVSKYLENRMPVEVLLADFKGNLIGHAITHD